MGSRITAFTVEGSTLKLFVSDCADCGVIFGIPKTLEDRRRADRKGFYCPNGHSLVFKGKSDEEKLREAEARETGLRDQLEASIRDAESARAALLRDRQRFANGGCPCCNRSFDNVRRHMATQHPEFPAATLTVKRLTFKCGCGRSFESYAGLRIHQGRARGKDWAKPGVSSWRAHLTVGATR